MDLTASLFRASATVELYWSTQLRPPPARAIASVQWSQPLQPELPCFQRGFYAMKPLPENTHEDFSRHGGV